MTLDLSMAATSTCVSFGLPEFQPFPKLARFNREVVITEKIDGTNAQVCVDERGKVWAGSRTRWVFPGKQDNFGFAAWVAEHEDELRDGLGEGRHYGEWFGAGIQRGYGLSEKRFALFNVARWGEERPACCDVVPVLYHDTFVLTEQGRPWSYLSDMANRAIEKLDADGSYMVPGFMRPEGIVIFHRAAGVSFKITLEKDEVPKALAERGAA